MFAIERIEYIHPISSKRPNPIDYVITYNSKVIFGRYSDTMQKFYDNASTQEVVYLSKDIYSIIKVFKACYTPYTEQEYVKYILKKHPRKLSTRISKKKLYDCSRYFYTKVPESKLIRPRRSLFLSFLKTDYLVNTDDHIAEVIEKFDDIMEDIISQLEDYLPSRQYA